MKGNAWQWFTSIILAIIGIIVSLVLFLFSSATPPAKVSNITSNDNVQIVGPPGTTVTINKKDPKEILQLVSKLQDKIKSLEKELEEHTRTTKDKHAEGALVASKAGNYEKAKGPFESLREGKSTLK